MQHRQTAQRTPLVIPTDLYDREARRRYVREYAWAIPSEEALAAIAEVSRAGVVEVGAGGGYWAQLLRERGVRVEAFDLEPIPGSDLPPATPDTNEFIARTWGGVRKAPASIAGDYPGCTLMLCWPKYEDSMAREALESYRGDTLVFIGELTNSWNGTPNVADDEFFELLRSEWEMVREVAIPQWGVPYDGMEDTLSIWRRRQPRRQVSIVNGPEKDELIHSLTDPDPSAVTFTPEWGDPIEVFILSLDREDGSAENWNFQARLAGKNQYVHGFYSTRTRRGYYKPAGS